MKRLLLLAALLLSCAVRQAAQAAPPHWSPTLRANVLLQCRAHDGSEPFCDCMTETLEALSPDPRVDFTPGDIRAGLKACERFGGPARAALGNREEPPVPRLDDSQFL